MVGTVAPHQVGPTGASRRARLTWSIVGVAVAVVASLLALRAAGSSGLAFFTDDRISIVSPDDLEEVALPVTVEWTAADLGGGRVVAVFVDREPMAPGKDLDWLARNDDVCRATPSCPDTQWLADRGVHVVEGTSLRIEALPDLRGERRTRDVHTVTLVVLDERGRRLAESAWARDFVVARESEES